MTDSDRALLEKNAKRGEWRGKEREETKRNRGKKKKRKKNQNPNWRASSYDVSSDSETPVKKLLPPKDFLSRIAKLLP